MPGRYDPLEDLPPPKGTPAPDPEAARQQWLAALAYAGPLCLLAIFARRKTPFLRWHAQQGFVLLFLEALAFALVIIVQATIGRIPVLGLLVEIVLKLAVFVLFLLLSVIGFVKALAGEEFRFPVIDEYAERVPIHD
jgi:uncharacterized membrane protein